MVEIAPEKELLLIAAFVVALIFLFCGDKYADKYSRRKSRKERPKY